MTEDSFEDPRFGRSILYTFLPEPNNNITEEEEEFEGDTLVSFRSSVGWNKSLRIFGVGVGGLP